MFFNVAGIIIFLSVCGIVVSNPDRSVDCRKFVFAPLCRGVAAKRASIYELINFGNDESLKPFVKPVQSPVRSLRLQENESFKPFLKLIRPTLKLLALQDNKSFKKLVKPIESAIESIMLQDNESLKPVKPPESAVRSIALQDNESSYSSACENF